MKIYSRGLANAFATTLIALASLCLAVHPAHAQISLAYTGVVVSLPGTTDVRFSGTVHNLGATSVDLDNVFFNLLSGPPAADLTSAISFSQYYAPTTLTAGQTYTGDIFSVDIDSAAPLGAYTGNLSLSYGGSSAGQDASINLSKAATVPESDSLPLIGLGIVGASAYLRFRRNRRDAAIVA